MKFKNVKNCDQFLEHAIVGEVPMLSLCNPISPFV